MVCHFAYEDESGFIMANWTCYKSSILTISLVNSSAIKNIHTMYNYNIFLFPELFHDPKEKLGDMSSWSSPSSHWEPAFCFCLVIAIPGDPSK